jgi:hypothetical protein
MNERKTFDDRETARITEHSETGSIGGPADLRTPHEGRAEAARGFAPGGGNTVGAGRGSADLGKVGGVDSAPDDVSGSAAGLGAGSGDLGAGGGLADDLGDTTRTAGEESRPDEADDADDADDTTLGERFPDSST